MGESKEDKLTIRAEVGENPTDTPTNKPETGEAFFRDIARRDSEQAKLEIAKEVALAKDLELCRLALQKIILAFNNRELNPERVMIKPSILLLPFPYLNGENGNLEIRVSSMDTEDSVRPYDELIGEMHRLPFFPSMLSVFDDASVDSPNFEARANLVRGITNFIDEFLCESVTLEQGTPIDFLGAAAWLEKAEFLPPVGRRNFEIHRKHRTIIVDSVKLMQFKVNLVSYFERKDKERRGLAKKRESLQQFALNTSTNRVLAVRKEETGLAVEDILRDYLKGSS